MSPAQPIPIASTSKVSAIAASPAFAIAASIHASVPYGSFNRFSLGLSPSMKAMLGSSIDMEHGSVIKSLQGRDAAFLSEDMCRDYTCCGLTLKDLHALVEHFEEAHVLVVDQPVFAPTLPDAFSAGGFDIGDDMEIDEPEVMSSAPVVSASAAAMPSFPGQSVLVQRAAASTWNAAGPSFAPYPALHALRRYHDYSTDASECVVPELLFSPSVTPSPAGSRDGSPDPVLVAPRGPSSIDSSSSSDDASTPLAMSGQQQPQRVFLTRAAGGTISASDLPPPRPKPFRCPKPGCSKAYKQANGLKYHLQHGQCNFAPLDPNSDELKPYICQAGCGKRFKNMSGLRYHYLHSTHGEQGLALLDAGKHP
ncbi:hypothetical protein BKA62DRAFT_680438 [Auriculariales sp. MPI-PUGE-AT-0066]|nr:hypothetical protein BKA62DRAFT_680438 [Auriculariales sp. MPI-PUGE-AT-0066]